MINLDDEKDQLALDFMGNAYLIVPRSVLDRAFSPDEQERQVGILHLLLFVKCYYMAGYVQIAKTKMACERGEFIGSLRNLALLGRICPTSVYRQASRLVDQNLIIMNRIPGGSRIKVCGYNLLAPLREKMNTVLSGPAQDKSPATCLAEAEKLAGKKDSYCFPKTPFY